MTTSDLVETFFDYKKAVAESQEEYRVEGSWHVDICCCPRCKRLEKWVYLPWHQKLRARLGAFITYGTID